MNFKMKYKIFAVFLCISFFVQTVSANTFYEFRRTNVTRSEFAEALIRLSGIDAEVFSDKEDKYLTAAYKMGYMQESETDNLTGIEAVKGILAILGYDKVVKLRGGTDAEYLSEAVSLNLIPNGYGEEITSAVLSEMLRRAENTVTVEPESVGEKVTYRKSGKTLLEYNLNIYKTDGILTDNGYTGLTYKKSECGVNRVIIGGTKYLCTDEKLYKYLGYNLSVYYKDNDGEPEIVAAEPKNTVSITVNGYDLTTVSKEKIKYDRNGKEEYVKLGDMYSLILNGIWSEYKPEYVNKVNGTLEFIDNDDDGFFEVVSVMNYKAVIAESIISEKYSVIDRISGKELVLDETDSDNKVFVYVDGNRADFKRISANDVILYALGTGGRKEIKTALISNETISGTVTAIDDDYITVDDIEKIRYTPGEIKNLRVGVSGTFYTDYFGKAVFLESEREYVFGYVRKIAQDPMGKVEMRIFSQYNRWVTLPVADRVQYNISGSITKNELFKKLDNNSMLITYKVSEDRTVTAVNFAQSFAPWSDEENDAIEAKIFRINFSGTKRYSWSTFGGNIAPTGDTIIFVIPSASDKEATEESYYITNKSSLPAATYTMSAYNCDKTMQPEVCLVEAINSDEFNGDSPNNIMIVRKVVHGYFDDTPTYAIEGLYAGNEYTLYTKDEKVLDGFDLKCGDIIQIVLTKKGAVKAIEYRGNCDEGYSELENYYSQVGFFKGEILSADTKNNHVLVKYSDTNAYVVDIKSRISNVYLYDSETKKIRVSSVSEIKKGDYAYISVRYGQVCEMIIIRGEAESI